MKARNLLTASLIILAFLVSFVSCEKKETTKPGQGKVKVVTTLFPLYDFARNVGGWDAEVTLLLPPGVEPHSFEPKPGDILKINSADLFIYTGRNMEPWVEVILKGIDNKKLLVVDASEGITLLDRVGGDQGEEHESHGKGKKDDDHRHDGKVDPHVWLDLSRARKMVDNVREGFVKIDPGRKESYMKNAKQYEEALNSLDTRFREGLASCKHRLFVHGGHFAFNYLAKRYDLEYVSAYEGSPNAEPTPRKVLELKRLMQEKGVKFIFYEELITPRVAEVLARETGASLLSLHGAHNISKEDMEKGITFLSIMERNLTNLRKGLECR